MIRIIVCGAAGRMGKRIVACAIEHKDIKIAGAIDREGQPDQGKDIGECAGVGRLGVLISSDLKAIAPRCDVIIDFSQHEATARNAATAAVCKKPIVIGTTGLSDVEFGAVRKASRKIACVISPNMSVGVNMLFRIARDVAESLGDEYDVEIVETHHRFKKDAPSGTALRLAESVADARGRNLESDVCYGRHSDTGERPKGQIGIHALRQGDIVGEHTVSFATAGERIELTHRAHSRDTFARGSLRAARWILRRKAGLYDMKDVLNANPKGK